MAKSFQAALTPSATRAYVSRMIKNRLASDFSILAIAIALIGCEAARAAEPPTPEPYQGVVEHEDRSVGFETTGRVLAVNVERGERVQAGEVIATLDDSLETPLRDLRIAELHTAEAQLALLKAGSRVEDIRAAEAQIASLRAREDMARKNLDRTKTLYERGSVAQSEVDELSASVDSTLEQKRALEEQLKALKRGARGEEISAALARVEAATAALAAQEAKLARYTLSAMIDGDIIDVHVKPGEMVAQGALALTVADLDRPYVDVFVPQSQAGKVRVGAPAKVRVDSVKAELSGKVEHVFPKTEFTPRFLFSEGERENLVVRARVRIDDPKHLVHAGVPAFVTLAQSEPSAP